LTIKAPVTVLVAHSAEAPLSREQIFNLYQSQYENLAEKKIQVIDDSYHFIMIDQPADFSAVLASVVEKG
jgi:pimeloyl-ACP methyl ester carboxylesterase